MKRVAEITSVICDVCGSEPATSYFIHKGTKAEWVIDLCDSCSAPIREWEKKGRAPKGKRRPYRIYGGKVDVVLDGPAIHLEPGGEG